MRRPFLIFPILTDPLPREGEGTGEGAGAGGDQGAGSGAGEGTGGGQQGLLTGDPPQGGQGGQPPAAPEIPEKFLVKGADGQIDHKATLEKALPSYLNLEKRFGAGEAPPESADKYKIENYLPEGYDRNAEAEKAILGKMHGLGLSNKQAQGILSLYGELLGDAVAQEKAGFDAGQAALKEAWGESYTKNLGRANFALSTLGDADTVKAITGDPKLMNNPALVKLLAKMGENLEDDTTANQMEAGEIEATDALMRSAAYLDPNHADHKHVVAKVIAAFARGYKPTA